MSTLTYLILSEAPSPTNHVYSVDVLIQYRTGRVDDVSDVLVWWEHTEYQVLVDIDAMAQQVIDGTLSFKEMRDRLLVLGHDMHVAGHSVDKVLAAAL